MDYAAILEEAKIAAREAVAVASEKYPEMAGACGFAWAKIDGKDGLANWCRQQIKKAGKGLGGWDKKKAEQNAERTYGSKGYPNGWQFWNPGDHSGQRIDIKEAGARAFRDKLAEYGVRADVGSRLD